MAKIHFGNHVAGSTLIFMPNANQKAASRFQNTTGQDWQATHGHIRWSLNYAGAGKIKMVVYADSAGAPGALIAVSSTELVGAHDSTTWYRFDFAAPITITDGAFYWLGLIGDLQQSGGGNTAVGSGHVFNNDTYADGPSDPFGAVTTSTRTLSVMLNADDDGTLRLGRASLCNVPGNYQPDREHGEKFTLAGSDSVELSAIKVYVTTTSAGVKSRAAIFADNAGVPGAKIAQTDEVTGATSGTWLSLPFSSPPTIAPGDYWLAFICDINLTTGTIPYGGFLWVDGSDTTATAFTSPSSLASNQTPNGIAIYADYTVVGGGGGGGARPVVFVCT